LVALFLLSLAAVLPAWAQDTAFGYGVHVNGTVNDASPRTVYQFTGLRGDVIAIDLSVTSGSLDPMLTLMDGQGTVIALSDDAAAAGRGSRDLHLDSLHLPRSDQYSLVVGRFGYGLGTTSGGYTLAVDRIGVSSESGSALRYGDSVYNTITDSTPQVYYAFRAARGDVISVRMQRASGDLDPALMIVNSKSQIVADNDDSPGTLDAAINGFIIREDGVFVIIASRFGEAAGRSKGSFVLTLGSGVESGLGKSIDLAFPLLSGVPVAGEITNSRTTVYYSFDGKRDDVVSIRMSRPSGALDSYLALLDPTKRQIASDDDGGGGQDALINSVALPMDGTYIIAASRFTGDSTATVGAYTLSLTMSGNAYANVQNNVTRLEIPASVQGAITSAAPQVVYAVVARAGDSLTITMDRVGGNLDSRVVILDVNQRQLASDDDGGGKQNSLLRFKVPSTGVYYLVATRFSGTDGDPNTTGTYTLTLAGN
jgi:hypothetical protein